MMTARTRNSTDGATSSCRNAMLSSVTLRAKRCEVRANCHLSRSWKLLTRLSQNRSLLENQSRPVLRLETSRHLHIGAVLVKVTCCRGVGRPAIPPETDPSSEGEDERRRALGGPGVRPC